MSLTKLVSLGLSPDFSSKLINIKEDNARVPEDNYTYQRASCYTCYPQSVTLLHMVPNSAPVCVFVSFTHLSVEKKILSYSTEHSR